MKKISPIVELVICLIFVAIISRSANMVNIIDMQALRSSNPEYYLAWNKINVSLWFLATYMTTARVIDVLRAINDEKYSALNYIKIIVGVIFVFAFLFLTI